MEQLYRNQPVCDTAIFKALREHFGVELPKMEMAVLCMNSRGIPAQKELPVEGKELLVTRFISANPSDTVNLLSLAEMFNEEEDTFWLPFAEDGLGGYYCLKFGREAEDGVFWKDENETHKVSEDLKAFLQLLKLC